MDVRIFVSDYISELIRENGVHFMCPERHDIFLFLRISYIYTIKYDYIDSTTSPKSSHTLINMSLFQVNVLKEIPLTPVSTVHVCVDVGAFTEARKFHQ